MNSRRTSKSKNEIVPINQGSARFGEKLKSQLRSAAADGLRRYMDGEIPTPGVVEEKDYLTERLISIIPKMTDDERIDLFEAIPARFKKKRR